MSRESIEEAIEVLEDASADMLMETGDKITTSKPLPFYAKHLSMPTTHHKNVSMK